MNNENLKPFSKTNPPPGKGRKPGSRNRSTIFRKWLGQETVFNNPLSGVDEKLTVADCVVLALIDRARKGNISAAKELFDSAFGKLSDSVNQKLSINLSELSDEELQQIIDGEN